jgi:hypothetical protein
MTEDPRRRLAFAAAAVATGVIAAIALPGHSWGVNIALVVGVLVVTVWVGLRPALGRVDSAFVWAGVLPAGVAVVRGAGWLIVLQLCAALGSISVGAARSRGWTNVVFAPLRALGGLPWGPRVALEPLWARLGTSSGRDFGPALRGGVAISALLLVFGGLFLSADAAFAALAEDWLVPDIDIGLLPARVLMFVGGIALAGSVARLSPVFHGPVSPWAAPGERGTDRSFLTPGDWKLGLILLNTLFGAFVLVQLTVLFGGRTHVLESAGLTYAQYARQGFFQLLVVGGLIFAVIAAAVRFGGRERSDRTWLRVLLGLLCVSTLVILASAFKRMDLYQEEYGFTRLRLFVDLAILGMAVVFGLVIAAGIKWDGRWLPRAVVATTVALVVGFGIYNPDARIAERNIERFQATGDIHLGYLASLSTDAVPELLELSHPRRDCVIAAILARSRDDSFWALSLSREVALSLGSDATVTEKRCDR